MKRATAERNSQLLKYELEWMRSTPQARTGKSKSRIDAFYDLKERSKYQEQDDRLEFGLQMQRLGGKILEMSNVSKSYGDLAVLKDFDYVFKRGERIGLIGKNGVGKSTFLNLITGSVMPDRGRIGIKFDEGKSVIDTVRDIAEVVNYGKDKVYTADQLLAHFMFPYKMHRQPVALLSGGEKRRLYLLTVLVSNPNFLILDEPTNDLDLLTLQKLEDFLQGYKGCLLVVSHDRFFMDEVVDQLFVFQGDGNVKGFMGNYSQYKDYLDAKQKEERKEKAAEKKDEPRPVKQREKVKRSFKEQREYENLTKEMAELEAEKKIPPPQTKVSADAQASAAERERQVLQLLREAGLTVVGSTESKDGASSSGPRTARGGELLKATGLRNVPVHRAYTVDGRYPDVVKALKAIDDRKMAAIPDRVLMRASGRNRWTLEIWL